MPSNPQNQRSLLLPGQNIEGFFVKTLISEGTFGAVFHAADGARDVAIKVESKTATHQLLQKESLCLLNINQGEKGKESTEPFLNYIAYGETDSVRYLIMDYAGPNLFDLRLKQPSGKFSETTTLWVLFKSLHSVRSLHQLGWLHRDIKPANFCIGRNPRSLFLVDFGFAKYMWSPDGTLLPRRPASRFYGTIRYSSLNSHNHEDMSRWDDVISLYYIAVENLLGRLPWTGQRDIKTTIGLKRHFYLLNQLSGDVTPPSCFQLLHHYLPHLNQKPESYYTEPDYLKLIAAVFSDLTNLNFSRKALLDWEEEKQGQIEPVHDSMADGGRGDIISYYCY